MGTYEDSILTETKQVLGVAEDVIIFDQDIRMHINSAFGTLNQLGLGPEGGFEVVDADAIWSDFLNTDLHLAPVKSYVHLRVKLIFDPPQNSWMVVAMKDQIEQLEWRLNLAHEDTIPFVDTTIPVEIPLDVDGGIL